MKRILIIPGMVLLCICSLTSCKHEIDPLSYVDPFVATCCTPDFPQFFGLPDAQPHGNSRCTPGALTPFGMVNVGPVTRHSGDTPPGYDAHDSLITGFPFMRTSGSGWCAEFGNLLTMPTNGPLNTCFGLDDGSIKGFASYFKKDTEKASAGYYSVILDDYGIRTECTASPHGGVLRFTYPASETSRFLCDLAFRITGSSDHQDIHVIDDHSFEGHMNYTPKTGGWGNGAANVKYDLYFYASVDKPLKDYGFWSADIPEDFVRLNEEVNTPEYMKILSDAEIIRGKDEFEGDCIGFFSEFPTTEGEKVELKVAFSFVDAEGARKNFKAELEGKDFEAVRSSARDSWAEALGKVRIKGGTPDQRSIFYSALYHSMVDPRIFSDVDGRFWGGDWKTHDSEGYTRRTLFSGWDVFRSEMPLHTIVTPEMVQDFVNSQVGLAEESGMEAYSRWEMLNAYTGCMIGNPTISVIADAWQKGIRGFDLAKALKYSVHSTEIWGIPEDLGYCTDESSVSNTLEHSYFAWCVARLAEGAGDTGLAARFDETSHSWRNLFNPDLGWFQPKYENGEYIPMPETGAFGSGSGMYALNYRCCEANLMQQGWFVPHEFDSFIKMAGGTEPLIEKLDELFENTPFKLGWTEYYHHGNEPQHWVPFLYNKLGQPWKSQKWCRTILDKDYFNDVEGMVGNEDEGQLSAWYVLVASGMHPSCPGDGRMEILSPIFDKVEFKLDPRFYKGKKFTIVTHGNSEDNMYIQKARLNGEPLDKCWFDFSAIAEGGKLELWMGPEPNKDWGLE